MTDNPTSTTPLQRIESALAWLGELRAGATPGLWEINMADGEINALTGDGQYSYVSDFYPVVGKTDAALIVALTHPAVLDAVEAVLESAYGQFAYSGSINQHDEPEASRQALAIADALLATKPEGGK
jgi:hypothetical protein